MLCGLQIVDIIMNFNPAHDPISEQAYLQGELLAETRHEFMNGQVYTMAENSDNHNLLSLNVASELRFKLKDIPCRTFMVEMKVKVGVDFFYPDVMVVCQQDNVSNYYKTTPVIIVEVLSKSTRRIDKINKRLQYQQIPSLEEYVLIEQDSAEIEVFSRQNHWQSAYYYLGDEITFTSLDVTVRVEDIYHQVNNEDVLEFLREKSA
jgi:Uma2 family endonuclease